MPPPPFYVPTVYHGKSYGSVINLPWAALSLETICRGKGAAVELVEKTPRTLRAHFGLSTSTKIILRFPGPDAPIERWWEYRTTNDLVQQAKAVEPEYVIAPNYSFANREPRTQHLHNRKRSLICAEEFSAAGLSTVIVLQAITDHDWQMWGEFLKAHSEISLVAKEFQTGNKARPRAMRTLEALTRLQDTSKRPLHLFAIGAAQYRREIAARFDRWTVIDSTPFIKAIKRHAATRDANGNLDWQQAPNVHVPTLIEQNVREYAETFPMPENCRPFPTANA